MLWVLQRLIRGDNFSFSVRLIREILGLGDHSLLIEDGTVPAGAHIRLNDV